MLQLLLDEHIAPAVARGLKRVHRSLVVHSMPEWEGGRSLGEDDDACLERAYSERLTLVTYDLRTISTLLKAWAELGRDHAGVIFVKEKTIPSAEIGGLVSALVDLIDQTAEWNWTNRVSFLRR